VAEAEGRLLRTERELRVRLAVAESEAAYAEAVARRKAEETYTAAGSPEELVSLARAAYEEGGNDDSGASRRVSHGPRFSAENGRAARRGAPSGGYPCPRSRSRPTLAVWIRRSADHVIVRAASLSYLTSRQI